MIHSNKHLHQSQHLLLSVELGSSERRRGGTLLGVDGSYQYQLSCYPLKFGGLPEQRQKTKDN